MRAASDNLARVLVGGGFATELVVDVFYGATRTLEHVPVAAWDLKWDSEAKIKARGTVTVIYSDDMAESITPHEFTDVFAPFGQELNIGLRITADDEAFDETVQLGHYRITAVPDAVDSNFQALGRTLTVGSRLTLTIEDRMVALDRKGFRSEQNPPSLTSCWAEIQRLSGMQVIRSVPDKPIPAATQYKAAQGGLLTAVQELANVLGGVAYITPDGALSVLPDANGPIVNTLAVGTEGTVMDVSYSMESDGVYNVVVGNFQDDDQNPIYSVAEITTGPFATNGPYGEYTRYYASPFVKTQAAGDSAVKAILTQSSSTQSYRVPVQCILDPRIEDGDMVSVQRLDGSTIEGRVMNHTLPSSILMSLELQVARPLT